MSKILTLALIVLLVWWILKRYRRQSDRRDPPAAGNGKGEDMVRCVHCGVHLPRSERRTARGAFDCSAEHRRLHEN